MNGIGGGPGAGVGVPTAVLLRGALLIFGGGMANGSRTGPSVSGAVRLSRLTWLPDEDEVRRSPASAVGDAPESGRDDALSATAATMSASLSSGVLCTHAAATSVLTIKPAITNQRLRGVMSASGEKR